MENTVTIPLKQYERMKEEVKQSYKELKALKAGSASIRKGSIVYRDLNRHNKTYGDIIDEDCFVIKSTDKVFIKAIENRERERIDLLEDLEDKTKRIIEASNTISELNDEILALRNSPLYVFTMKYLSFLL